MKPIKWFAGAALAITAVGGFAQQVAADVVLSDSFSYPDGALLGQGGWTITGTSTTNPLQVSASQVPLTTTGQDAFSALTSAVVNNAGASIFTAFELNVSAAQTGDYFAHLSDPAGTTTNFFQRIFARSSDTGFQIGVVDASGTGSTTTYGTDVLSFNTPYRVVASWDFVSGANNDLFQVYVNPTDVTENANPTYLTHAWTSATAELGQLSAFNLRQGTAASAPTLALDNLIVATSFAEAAAIPEPASLGLVILGTLVLLVRRRAWRPARRREIATIAGFGGSLDRVPDQKTQSGGPPSRGHGQNRGTGLTNGGESGKVAGPGPAVCPEVLACELAQRESRR